MTARSCGFDSHLRHQSSTPPDSRAGGGDAPSLTDELQFLSAFIAAHVVGVAFASKPRYTSDVVREFRAHYLEFQDDENRAIYSALLDDRLPRYETAVSTRRPDQREEHALATAFADVCGDAGYDFCSVAADLIAQELIS